MAMDEVQKIHLNDLVDLATLIQRSGVSQDHFDMVFTVACRLAFPFMNWDGFQLPVHPTPLPYQAGGTFTPRWDMTGIPQYPPEYHRPEVFTQPKVELTTPKEFDEKVNGHPT